MKLKIFLLIILNFYLTNLSYSDTIILNKTVKNSGEINYPYCDSILLEISSSNNDTLNIISYRNLIKFYKKKNELINAKSYLNAIINLAELLPKKSKRINIFLGDAYTDRSTLNFKSDVSGAMIDILKAVKIYDKFENEFKKAGAYMGIGNVYLIVKDFRKSLNYYFLASTVYKKLISKYPTEIKYKVGLANCSGNISIAYAHLNKHNLALRYLDMAFKFHTENKDTFQIANALFIYGNLYKNIGNYKLAKHYSEKAYKLSDSKKIESIKLSTMNLLIEIYINLKEFDKALIYSKILIEKFNERNDLYNLSYTYLMQSKIFKEYKKYDLALDNFEKYKTCEDSIYRIELIKNSQNLEEKYQSEKKQNEINTLKNKNEIKNIEIINSNKLKNRYLIILILSIVAVILILFILVLNIRSKKKQKIIDAEIMEFRINIAKYQSQMNPHFIFNAISGIQNFILTQKLDDALKQTVSFSKLMRQMLNNSDKEFINLSTEINFLNDYVYLERGRFNKHILFNFNLDYNVDAENTLILPMLLQPFIENCILHAGFNNILYPEIKIEISDYSEDLLSIYIIDNGIGYVNSHKTESKALNISKKRIELYLKKYNFENIEALSITNRLLTFEKTSGTIVKIILPKLINYEKD